MRQPPLGGLSRRSVIGTMASVALSGCTATGERDGDERGREADGPTLHRLATTAAGAEITGMFLSRRGDFFFNVQHPDSDNAVPYDRGAVGALAGYNLHDLPREFPSVQLPENERERRTVRTAVGSHQVLASGGDALIVPEGGDVSAGGVRGVAAGSESEFGPGGERLGVPYAPDGTALTDAANPDFNGFVLAEGARNEGYLFTNWEDRPGTMSRLKIRLSDGDARWQVLESANVDFRGVGGTWMNCFGTVSPWGTPLSGEENYAAAATRRWNDPDWDGAAGVERLARYLGHRADEDGDYVNDFPNPYRYGYVVEVAEPTGGSPTPEKRFAMGRFAHENAVVLPDERTAYLSDDGTGKAFYKFIADEAGDLSAGTLYAAKANQDRGDDVAEVGFELEWVELAHGADDEIESWIAEYDGVTQADYESGESSYVADEEVGAWARGETDDDRAAFLETTKAAREAGATAEFRKMEGVNARRDAEPGDYLYVAMSAVTETMSDGEGDIKLRGNESGALYRMRLEENYDVRYMEPVVTGGPDANVCGGCPYDASPNAKSGVCRSCEFNPTDETSESSILGTNLLRSNAVDPENTVANPDNVIVMDDGRVLIGEDSELHDNNMIWVYDPVEGR